MVGKRAAHEDVSFQALGAFSTFDVILECCVPGVLNMIPRKQKDDRNAQCMHSVIRYYWTHKILPLTKTFCLT